MEGKYSGNNNKKYEVIIFFNKIFFSFFLSFFVIKILFRENILYFVYANLICGDMIFWNDKINHDTNKVYKWGQRDSTRIKIKFNRV